VKNMDIEGISGLLEEINTDRSVPRNIRTLVMEAKTHLNDQKQEMPIRINSVISILDEVSADPNVPVYTRTQIWNIVSLLEVMNEKIKADRTI